MTTATDLPLAGFRVIDLTSVLFGPYTTQLLGDLGADVIKVEAPEGDVTRHIGPARHAGMAAGFLGINRNKRSIVLDLKRAPARDALWQLVDGADVFVHNIRPQKIQALGFDVDAVMARRPTVVYGALHGYLEGGPYAGRPAYDDVIQGECGVAHAFALRDGKPALAPTVIADKSAGLVAAVALNAALVKRLRSGRGVYVEIGMFETLAAYTLVEHQFGNLFVPPEGGPGYTRVISPERKPFATADGHICMLAYTDRQWRAFWQLAGQPQVAADPRFVSMAERTRHIDALYAQAGAVLATRTSAEWLEVLAAAEIPCGRINTFEDLRHDPQLGALGFFRPFAHPSEGELEIPDSGMRIDRAALPLRHHAPGLGEQGEAILREAGLDEAAIRAALG
ncbi:MAG: CoA transferase [Gammaproteobacteria bacterium]|nr:CoA transferase [Gammaproteobacteria bacterium]